MPAGDVPVGDARAGDARATDLPAGDVAAGAPLTGSVALVTGARRGIGRATALRLGALGARVAVTDLAVDSELDELAGAVEGIPVAADLSKPGEIAALVSRVESKLGPADVCVANAAAMSMGAFAAAERRKWWHQIDVNLSGTFHLLQAVLPGMRRLGHGRIVVMTSEWGVIGWPNASGYAASKAGLIALVKTLGRELGPEGILVNAVAPSVVDTAQLDVDARDAGVSGEEIRARYAERIPLGRVAEPAEIAATVAFLAGPGGSAFAGQILQPGGGATRTRA